MNDLILSLGSNIEPKEVYLKKAIKKLNNFFELVKISSLYKTYPLEDTDQEIFYNLCVNYKTGINNPDEVHKITREIEKKLGRIKDESRPKGPRIIDIDIIFFNDFEVKSEKLKIPHEKMFFRNFCSNSFN